MMTGSCTVVGIVQLIIGISTSQSNYILIADEDSIFILFLIFGLVSLGLLIIRTIILCCFRNEQI